MVSQVRLLLIRHGQTPSNVDGKLDTAMPGAGLTPLGEIQAQAIPEALAKEDVASVYVSRLVRTQLTAAPLAESREIEARVQPGLEEIPAGDLEMRNDDEAVHIYAETAFAWMHGDLSAQMPGGVDGHTFLRQYDAAVRSILGQHGPNETVAIVSHGAAIRVYSALATGLDPSKAIKLRIMNTGMSVLEGHAESGWHLAAWHSEPLGGLALEDVAAHDVTGESVDDAIEETYSAE
jgi:probable phosphoglycerate mutase